MSVYVSEAFTILHFLVGETLLLHKHSKKNYRKDVEYFISISANIS